MAEQKITFDKLVRWVGSGSLVLAVLYITNYLSSVLLPFFIAWLFAYLLYPMVKFIQYRMKLKVRALAIIIAMLIVLTAKIKYDNRFSFQERSLLFFLLCMQCITCVFGLEANYSKETVKFQPPKYRNHVLFAVLRRFFFFSGPYSPMVMV